MFIRFVVTRRDGKSGSLRGVIRAAHDLLCEGDLLRHEEETVNGAFDWLNRNLPIPPALSRPGGGNAISWFRASANDPISRMWDLVAVLREHGVPVEVVKTDNPGRVIYEDEWQVVATPLRDRNPSFR